MKLLKMSNFTCFHKVFYVICILNSLNSHISVAVYNFFEFGAPFSTVFQLYRGGQCTYPCFPGFFLFFNQYSARYFPSHWLLFYITIVETKDSGEQLLSSILGNNIGRAWDRTSDLLFSSLQLYRLIHMGSAC